MTNLEFRILSASKYLQSLSSYSKLEWNELYNLYLNGGQSLEERMCLVHPSIFKDLIPQKRIQGPRVFANEPGISTMKCQSSKLWEYNCCLVEENNNLVADHFFPYSLGGPTIAKNKVYLCKFHNQLKTNDIHFYPWEEGEPVWLKSQIDRINSLMR